jgi:hypothetical protein
MATIYKIYCRDSEITDCYVGSTEDFTERCRNHKKNCNNPNDAKYNYKVYKFIRANEGMDNFIIEPIYECDVEDRYIEEQRWFELLHATLNTKSPKRSKKEWRSDNDEYLKEYFKKYNENNKETISENSKIYYENNKEIILKKVKKYNENNKETISEYKNQKHNCDCGGKYTNTHKSRHIKSIKHQNYINSKL